MLSAIFEFIISLFFNISLICFIFVYENIASNPVTIIPIIHRTTFFLERDRRFRKREIKSRNYRRTESYDRRSNSPEERNRKNRKSSKSSAKNNYPKNWSEYNEEKLTTVKDEELKSKIFNQKTSSNLDLFCKLYNFETPAPFLEPFKYSTETETREVPFSHFRLANILLSVICSELNWIIFRVTRSHPKISYSVNFQKTKESFISRLQLFQIIPSSRRQLIEKLINSSG